MMTIGSIEIGWTKEEKDLGRNLIVQLASYMHEDLELADWFDGKDSSFGYGQISIWPEDLLLMARFILKNKGDNNNARS
jgi:hypothetical protein